MTNATPSRLGLINGTGADDALFLKKFSGEVLTAFETANVMMNRHLVRTITEGKSAQFPSTWKATANYHTPGAVLTGQTIKHGERVITVDDLLVADVFIARIDEAKNHYDVRSIYTTELGRALALQFDKTVLQVAINAARASSVITEAPGGSRVTNLNVVDTADNFVNAIQQSQQTLDEKDIPEDGRFVVMRPAQYYLMLNSDKLANKDFSATPGADFAGGKVLKAIGVEVVKSNNLPNAAITGSFKAEYDGDFSATKALVMLPSAVGTVKLLDMKAEGEYQIERKGTLMTADYAVGHGVLRPECAVEIATA